MISIFAILILMVISGSIGFAMKEGEGLLSEYIAMNSKLGDNILDLHEILSKILLILVGFHLIGAIFSSILTRENLIKSIFIDGLKKGGIK
jgi:cytochrome b